MGKDENKKSCVYGAVVYRNIVTSCTSNIRNPRTPAPNRITYHMVGL